MSYAAGYGCGCGTPVGGGLWTSAGTILVLYVLLVIILRTFI
ncbi:hypothetical protein ACFQZT_18380 [Paenibacillus sp. GCM10027628]